MVSFVEFLRLLLGTKESQNQLVETNQAIDVAGSTTAKINGMVVYMDLLINK